ncbi:MAG: transcription termination/antitermination protein NusA, partial [Candidatus Weimeria sp.]
SEDKRGARIRLTRTHPDFIRCLFTEEVSEIRDGIVEIKAISREAGNRTKIAVYSNDPDVDPVGACVGMNGSRVNAVVSEIGKEKIDIIEWSDNAASFIENALAPAKVIAVVADSDEKRAKVVVPDFQLSLAIGREGQNARLAARLTGFRIDIKSESQARELGDEFIDMSGYYDDVYDDDYEEGADSDEDASDSESDEYQEADDDQSDDYEDADTSEEEGSASDTDSED